jgi:uncharacterized protein with NAD-binding domain and iron-sulfur cluster
LKTQGHQVSVFEASRHIGGRARRIHSPNLGRDTDNGQHIMLGAYSVILGLMGEIGLDETSRLERKDLDVISADGHFRLRNRALPAPFHLLTGLLGAQGLSWSQKNQAGAFLPLADDAAMAHASRSDGVTASGATRARQPCHPSVLATAVCGRHEHPD